MKVFDFKIQIQYNAESAMPDWFALSTHSPLCQGAYPSDACGVLAVFEWPVHIVGDGMCCRHQAVLGLMRGFDIRATAHPPPCMMFLLLATYVYFTLFKWFGLGTSPFCCNGMHPALCGWTACGGRLAVPYPELDCLTNVQL